MHCVTFLEASSPLFVFPSSHSSIPTKSGLKPVQLNPKGISLVRKGTGEVRDRTERWWNTSSGDGVKMIDLARSLIKR